MHEISADWAAQRIKGLSLWTAVASTCSAPRHEASEGESIKTLIDEFQYPRLGPGQMWETRRTTRSGARRRGPPRPPVVEDRARRPARHGVVAGDRDGGANALRRRDHFLSTMPIRELIDALDAGAAAARDRRGGSLQVPRLPHRRPDRRRAETCFPTTGSTSTSRDVKLGRIQNFKNWCPDLVPDPTKSMPRPRVLLLRGRRPLDHVRRRADRARPTRDRRDRPGRRGRGRRRLRRPDAQGLPGLRRRLPGRTWP